ncbi:MAG TPA: DUF4179 domain-containing protein [Candidatus Limnocylindrales bacterium]
MSGADSYPDDALEVRLVRALAWQPSEQAIAQLDTVIGRVLAPRQRRWVRPLALLAAAVLLMGAAVTLTLVQQAASTMPGHRVAYDRGEILGLSQTVDGYTVVLERAYLDPNQLVLAFSVPDVAGMGPIVPRADVVDSKGRHYLDFAGGDVTDETLGSGTVLAYDVPSGVTGTVHLTVSVPFLMTLQTVPPALAPKEPLTYAFDLTVQPATSVTVDETRAVDGRSLSLRWLRFSATAVRLRLDTDLTGLPTADYPRWSLDASLRRPDGRVEQLLWMALPPEWTGQPKSALKDVIDKADGSVTIFQSLSGTDDPTGTWTVTVDRLIGYDGNGGTTAVSGPWIFNVRVP